MKSPASQTPTDTLEELAGIEFGAYALDGSVKSPNEWAKKLASPAMAMHVADRTLRMTKPELMAFIRKAGETDAATPEIMFLNLDGSQETLEGWSNLLGLARARYIAAASAACLKPEMSGETPPEVSPPTVPPEETFPAAPADLAEACLWAVRHRAWIDGELKASEWSDEKFDGESAKTNAVFTRAINEPSANLREITAKAALALEDFERFTLLPGRKLDDGTRIVHTVLREIVGVGREAGASAALTPSSDTPADRHPDELPLSILVPTVDFAGASLRELRAIREAADLVCNVACAATWQGSNRLSDDPNGGARFNRAGELMRWVSDALCHVVTAAQDEARRRLPDNNDDRGERLAMLAGSTIDNEDAAEIAAFARELLAIVEDTPCA